MDIPSFYFFGTRFINRAQLAGALGIGVDTLKHYEEGRRNLPFEVYYKLVQILKLDIGIITMWFDTAWRHPNGLPVLVQGCLLLCYRFRYCC